MLKFAFGAVAGWLLARYLAADRSTALVEGAGRAGRAIAAEAQSASDKLQHRHDDPPPAGADDATLAHKVETEIFRDDEVPKGQINVNSQNRVIQLRGEVPSRDMMRDLVNLTLRVAGVRSVENLLHLPGEEARMHQ